MNCSLSLFKRQRSAMLFRLLACVMALSLAPQAHAQQSERYATVVLGSAHFGVDLNDFNPGLLIGRRWQTNTPGLEYHLEGGVFYNSYEEVSPIVMGGVSYRLATVGPVEMRAGVSVGTAYYGELAPILERDYNIPNIEGFIPMAVASFSMRDLRDDRVEYRLTAVPGTQGIDALNLSIAFRF